MNSTFKKVFFASLIIVTVVLLFSITSYYGFKQPFLMSIVWSALMIITISISGYLSQKENKIFEYLGNFIVITGVFFFGSKILGGYNKGLFILVFYIVANSKTLLKVFTKS